MIFTKVTNNKKEATVASAIKINPANLSLIYKRDARLKLIIENITAIPGRRRIITGVASWPVFLGSE